MSKTIETRKFQTILLNDSFVNFLKYLFIWYFCEKRDWRSGNFPDTVVLAHKQRNNAIW